MKTIISGAALVLVIALSATPVLAKGCIKGAVAGGAAGHVAGHHGVLGAAAGCAIGHHEADKNQKSKNQSQ
jgi:hypothetical protein